MGLFTVGGRVPNGYLLVMNKQIAILLCLLVQIAGCATLDIKADVPPANNPSTPRRMNRLFWGMVNNKIPVADPIYPANGIQDVCYHESAGQVLVTILTVGVYSPIDYRYTLALSPYPNARILFRRTAPRLVARYSTPRPAACTIGSSIPAPSPMTPWPADAWFTTVFCGGR